jgi:hypothetical protein
MHFIVNEDIIRAQKESKEERLRGILHPRTHMKNACVALHTLGGKFRDS